MTEVMSVRGVYITLNNMGSVIQARYTMVV